MNLSSDYLKRQGIGGGLPITVMRGRGKLSTEVGASVLSDVLREFVLQKAALLVDNPQANGFPALRVIKLVERSRSAAEEP